MDPLLQRRGRDHVRTQLRGGTSIDMWVRRALPAGRQTQKQGDARHFVTLKNQTAKKCFQRKKERLEILSNDTRSWEM